MKKIFTLLFALGTVALVQAQPGSRDNRDDRRNDQRDNQQVDQRNTQIDQRGNNRGYEDDRDFVYNRPYESPNRYDDRFISVDRRRDMEIASINREFDYRIQRVRNSFYISRWEKEKQIRYLQAERNHEIKKVYKRFSVRMDRRDDGRRY